MPGTQAQFEAMQIKQPKQKTMGGFTLIEVLVASAILALMALISWRGLDGMSKAQVTLQTRTDANQVWQVGLAQWRTDLDSMVNLQNTPALDWDGRVLRITRQHSQDPQAGLQVVAWTFGNGQWTRWQSAPLTQRDAWTQAWMQAQVWGESAGNPMPNNAHEVLVHPIRSWQIYYHRDGAWSNPLSSAGTTTATAPGPNNSSNLAYLPEGIRLVIDLADNAQVQGKLTLDWVRPTFTVAKQ
jgi:general secretion pathway protein J